MDRRRLAIPGEFAGASLKPLQVCVDLSAARDAIPGEFAGASLKLLLGFDAVVRGVDPSPVNSPGPH